ncbi:hypothetical protein H4Q26_013330 [Puccinia striiformis f. sp. tritici PST-130]|nr:hypothetical protein H4Q26_013330 [Puccinia striiformis f. sp. tritici PST-130]
MSIDASSDGFRNGSLTISWLEMSFEQLGVTNPRFDNVAAGSHNRRQLTTSMGGGQNSTDNSASAYGAGGGAGYGTGGAGYGSGGSKFASSGGGSGIPQVGLTCPRMGLACPQAAPGRISAEVWTIELEHPYASQLQTIIQSSSTSSTRTSSSSVTTTTNTTSTADQALGIAIGYVTLSATSLSTLSTYYTRLDKLQTLCQQNGMQNTFSLVQETQSSVSKMMYSVVQLTATKEVTTPVRSLRHNAPAQEIHTYLQTFSEKMTTIEQSFTSETSSSQTTNCDPSSSRALKFTVMQAAPPDLLALRQISQLDMMMAQMPHSSGTSRDATSSSGTPVYRDASGATGPGSAANSTQLAMIVAQMAQVPPARRPVPETGLPNLHQPFQYLTYPSANPPNASSERTEPSHGNAGVSGFGDDGYSKCKHHYHKHWRAGPCQSGSSGSSSTTTTTTVKQVFQECKESFLVVEQVCIGLTSSNPSNGQNGVHIGQSSTTTVININISQNIQTKSSVINNFLKTVNGGSGYSAKGSGSSGYPSGSSNSSSNSDYPSGSGGSGYPSSTSSSGSGYPSSTTPSGSGYPSSTSPSGSGYPSSTTPSGSDYPSSTSPSGSGYPSSTPSSGSDYPSSTSPSGSGYPSSTPSSGSDYPSSTSPSGSGYPASTTPQGSGYPSSDTSGSGYPSSNSTGSGYPDSSSGSTSPDSKSSGYPSSSGGSGSASYATSNASPGSDYPANPSVVSPSTSGYPSGGSSSAQCVCPPDSQTHLRIRNLEAQLASVHRVMKKRGLTEL